MRNRKEEVAAASAALLLSQLSEWIDLPDLYDRLRHHLEGTLNAYADPKFPQPSEN